MDIRSKSAMSSRWEKRIGKIQETAGMFQRGPGEGYRAAKAETIAIEPRAVCKREAACGIAGYVIRIDGRAICSAGSARECWGKALDIIGRKA